MATLAESHHVHSAGDCDIHYWAGGRAGAPLVVLSLGAFTDHRMFDDQIAALHGSFRTLRWDPRGVLRVSLPLAGMLMMPALSAFMSTYPDVELDLDFTDRLVDVIDEGLDVVIRAGEVSDSRLMTRTLGHFRLMLVCSPDYIARHGAPLRPSDLSGHSCLHHRYATSGKLEPWPLQNWKDSDLPRRAVVNTIEPLIDMAERGLGIACLPDFAIRDQLRRGLLTAVLEDHTVHKGTFRLLWPSSRFMSPKLRVFVDFMDQRLFPSGRDENTESPLP